MQPIARGPVALADRDQAARDERRRLLQLELGRAVREPERAHELPRGARDPAHPGGARCSCSGRWCSRAGTPWLVLAAMFVDVRDRRRHRAARPSSTARGAARLRREHHAGQRPERRQHGRQGGPLRASPTRRSGRSRRPTPRTAPSTAAIDALTPRRRRGAARQHLPRRGDLRRRRLGPLRDVLLHHHRRLRRRADGRAARRNGSGKKIEAREIKYAAVGALFVPTMVLTLTAISIATKLGVASIFNPGAHGFTETLYAYDSQSNNNGSAFAGFGLTNFSADLGTVALLPRPLRADARRARPRRRAREEEDRAGVGGDVPHRRADVRRPARRRDRCSPPG